MRYLLSWVLVIPLVAHAGDATTRSYAPQPRQEDVEHNHKRLEEFAAFDPKYAQSMPPRMNRLYGLGAQVYAREASVVHDG